MWGVGADSSAFPCNQVRVDLDEDPEADEMLRAFRAIPVRDPEEDVRPGGALGGDAEDVWSEDAGQRGTKGGMVK